LMPIMISMTNYYNNFKHICRLISVFLLNYKIFFLAAFLPVVFFINYCEESPTEVGTGLLPASDFVNLTSTDTIGVNMFTSYIEAVRSDNISLSYMGRILDPYFGECSSDFVAQLRLGVVLPKDAFFIDSMKLFMKFNNVRGDVESVQYLRISEITEDLTTDTLHYSNCPAPPTAYDIPAIPLSGLKNDTINDVVLNVPVEFGNYLMRDTSKLFHSNTPPDFRNYFKGLYFRLSDGPEPLFLTLDLTLNNNYFTVYYRDQYSQNKEYSFIVNSRSRRYNRYMFDFNAASPDKKIKHINDGFKDTVTYMQSLEGGVFTKIKIPGLNSFKSLMPISVNKARLVVPVFLDDVIFKTTTVPSQILLKYISTTGVNYVVPDYIINPNFFDGSFNSTQKVYTFNIASFVQEYLKGNIQKPELEMFLPLGLIKNVILKANNNPTPVQFVLTYTNF
jgi:hypothetical protein